MGPNYCSRHEAECLPKPVVAILPIKNSSFVELPWNVSSELTQGIRYWAECQNEIIVMSEADVYKGIRKAWESDFFGPDLHFTENFHGADYVVVMELIGHQEIAPNKCDRKATYPACHAGWPSALEMKMRIRIIHTRGVYPRLALEEIITTCSYLPPNHCRLDYARNCWGTKAYQNSPYGNGHRRFIQDIVNRIENITWGR